MKTFKNSSYAIAFILPFSLVFVLFLLYPIVFTFVLSLTDTKGFAIHLGDFTGLGNFYRVLTNRSFYAALGNTLFIWLVNFIPQLALALLLSVVLTSSRLKLRGAGFFRTAFYLPNLLTAASVTLLFSILFAHPNGTVNQLLVQSGLRQTPVNFFRSPAASQLITSGIQTWLWFGNTTIMLMAGISGISESLFEAATIDGANAWQTFRRITLPLLKPMIIYILVTSIVGGMQIFDIPFMLTDGRGAPDAALQTVSIMLYNYAFTGNNYYGYASAVAILLFVIISLLSLGVFYTLGEEDKRK